MGAVLDGRRTYASGRFARLKTELPEAEQLVARKACIYVTGSFGRGEAGTHSDLDVFIVGKTSGDQRALRKLDEIRLKAHLIDACARLSLPEFSGDGEYLEHHTLDDLVQTLGQPHDDAANTFTARLLLLLESRPLLGKVVYEEVIEKVIDAYWRDFADHRARFVPTFLANDILRLWRTFCVNYEARTQTEPARKKAKRKLKNYKLKHSRLLTCYSAIAYLLFWHGRHRTMTPAAAHRMTAMSPTERLEQIVDLCGSTRVRGRVSTLLSAYERFLRTTDAAEEDLIEVFMDKKQAQRHMADATKFGELTAALLSEGRGSPPNIFYRMLLV